MRAYSDDLRQRVLHLYDSGKRTREIGRLLDVSESWCRRVKQRRHDPRKVVGGSEPKLDVAAREQVVAWVAERSDRTLAELQALIRERLGIRVCEATVWNVLRELKLTLKKSRSSRASSSGPTSPRHARRSSPRS